MSRSRQGADGPLILVIEDMGYESRQLVEPLRDEGYRVETAGTAHDAVRHIKPTTYDAILLDIDLPLGKSEQPSIPENTPRERAGIEVLRFLRRSLKLTPVIVVTGLNHAAFWPELEQELRGKELQVLYIISKPCRLREVICALHRVTGWRGSFFKAFKRDDPEYCA